MTKNTLYTAIGKFTLHSRCGAMRYPYITLNGHELVLDMQEMTLWSVLNWRILTYPKIIQLYHEKEKEIGFSSSRSIESCLQRLIMRGLVSKGEGNAEAEALYDLFSSLYVLPITENIFLRIFSFIHLTFFSSIPYSTTKKLLQKDRRTSLEQSIMHLASLVTFSTAELIKCIEAGLNSFACDEDVLDSLYSDEVSTSENLPAMMGNSKQCFPVVEAIANLYLRKQIIFDRR